MKITLPMLNVILTCSLVGWAAVAMAEQPEPSQVSGSIKFAQKMDGPQQPGGKQCSVTVPAPGSAPLQKKMSDAGCGNDVVTFIKFENVPSSTVVYLNSERKCYDGDWTYGVRAIKNPSSTLWVDIRDIHAASVNEILSPGMMKVYHRYDHGNIEGKLSCAIINAPER